METGRSNRCLGHEQTVYKKHGGQGQADTQCEALIHSSKLEGEKIYNIRIYNYKVARAIGEVRQASTLFLGAQEAEGQSYRDV